MTISFSTMVWIRDGSKITPKLKTLPEITIKPGIGLSTPCWQIVSGREDGIQGELMPLFWPGPSTPAPLPPSPALFRPSLSSPTYATSVLLGTSCTGPGAWYLFRQCERPSHTCAGLHPGTSNHMAIVKCFPAQSQQLLPGQCVGD